MTIAGGGTLAAGPGRPANWQNGDDLGSWGNYYLWYGNAGASIHATGGGTATVAASLGLNGQDQNPNGGGLLGGFTPFTVDANTTLAITGNIAGVGAWSWGGISKYGPGTLLLTGNNQGTAQGMYLAGGTVEFSQNSLPLHQSSAPAGYAVDFEGNATLEWAPGNNQDISGNLGVGAASAQQIKIADGVTATFDTIGNNVTLGNAFAGPAPPARWSRRAAVR